MQNIVKARIQLKHDTEENWGKALRFIPLQGQPIIYDADPDNGQPFPRLKIGDGSTPVVDLPFFSANNSNNNDLIKINTTNYWATQGLTIPQQGTIIVYMNNQLENAIFRIKIGDGTTYLVDLPFIGNQILNSLNQHINNTVVHTTDAQRARWNNKLNYNEQVMNETLVLNRN